MNWQERVEQLERDEKRLERDRAAFVAEMAKAVGPYYKKYGTTEAALELGVSRSHSALILRLVRGQASTGFMKELAPGLDYAEGNS